MQIESNDNDQSNFNTKQDQSGALKKNEVQSKLDFKVKNSLQGPSTQSCVVNYVFEDIINFGTSDADKFTVEDFEKPLTFNNEDDKFFKYVKSRVNELLDALKAQFPLYTIEAYIFDHL